MIYCGISEYDPTHMNDSLPRACEGYRINLLTYFLDYERLKPETVRDIVEILDLQYRCAYPCFVQGVVALQNHVFV